MKLCLGCMREMEDHLSVCPHCGYDEYSNPKEGYYLRPGTVIAGKYVIGKVLGYGGFGITYIGWDQVLSRRVAIKEFFPSSCVTREAGSRNVMLFSRNVEEEFYAGLESFTSEARRLAQLNRLPGVVRIYDCVEDCGTGYIVMEFLDGMNIKELLKQKKRMEYEEAKAIIVEVLKTLSAVHEQQIIHRDISPDNIFLTSQGMVRLIDFGAARYVAGEYSRTLTVILKPGYAPEEQYLTHGDQGPWTDLYSTAACFYRMVTGKLPKEAIIRMDDDDLPRISEFGVRIPPNEEAAIMKALSIHREDRFRTAGEFLKALTEKNDEPVRKGSGKKEVPKKKAVERAEKESKKSPLPIVAAVAAVLVIAAAVFFFTRKPSQTEDPQVAQTEKEQNTSGENGKTEADVKTETEADVKTEIEADVKTETEADVKTETETEAKIVVPDPQPGPVSETVEPGLYVFTTAMDSGKVMHIVGDSTAIGASIELQDKDGSGFQIFRVEENGDSTFKIICEADQNYSLSVKNASDDLGAYLQMRPYEGGKAQNWTFKPSADGEHYLICSELGTCLDCCKALSESGTLILLWKQTENENQLWDLVKIG